MKKEDRPSKFSDFKPIQSAKTPLSMMQSGSERHNPYFEQSRGVIPGYQGHVPRARDTFGVTAIGGLAPDIHVGAHKPMGPMSGHDPTERVLGREDVDPTYPEYKDKKGGVMPGYAGFRPGARELHGTAAFGGIAREGVEGQCAEMKANWDNGRGGPGVDYKNVVSGIVPGYKGHVPEAICKSGTSHFGNAQYNQPVVGAQSGHETNGNAFDKAYEVNQMTKSGYAGHVPGARDTYGTTVFNPQ
jgi:hypothetical protein